jgi:hypothetical protein
LTNGVDPFKDAFPFSRESPDDPLAHRTPLKTKSVEKDPSKNPSQKPCTCKLEEFPEFFPFRFIPVAHFFNENFPCLQLAHVYLMLNCFRRDVKIVRKFQLDGKNSDHIIVLIDINRKGGLMAKEKVIIFGKAG